MFCFKPALFFLVEFSGFGLFIVLFWVFSLGPHRKYHLDHTMGLLIFAQTFRV